MEAREIVLILLCCSIVGLLGNDCLCGGLTSFSKILSWKNLGVVGKENDTIFQAREIPSAVPENIPPSGKNVAELVLICFRAEKIPSTELRSQYPKRESSLQ